MKTNLLFFINILKILIPETRCFGFKRLLYRMAGAKIGKNVRICSSAKITGNGTLSIGENTWIGHEALIISSSSIIIGKNIDIAPRVYIGTGTHIIDLTSSNIAGKGLSKDILIKDGSWIAANSTILPGIEVGHKSIVAAGAVVNKNVSDYSLVGGVPAQILKKLN